MTQVISDGGSSSYYEIDIPLNKIKYATDGKVPVPGETYQTPTHIRVEVKDIIKYGLDNDFDRGNIFKALVRLGRKAGADEKYDINKCMFFLKEIMKDYD